MKSKVAAFDPVAGSERIGELDIVRGFALLGILLINWRSPTLGNFVVAGGSGVDESVRAFVEIFVHQKFYPLFAMMFGVGLALQADRTQRAGVATDVFLIRRLVILFVIGLFHQFLVWNGDVLHVYATCGILLLLCRRFPSWLLVMVGAILVLLPSLNAAIPPTWLEYVPTPGTSGLVGTSLQEPYLTLGYSDLVAARVTDFVIRKSYVRTFLGITDILGLFMIGLVIGRNRSFLFVPKRKGVVAWAAVLGLLIGLLGHMWDFTVRRLPVLEGWNPGLAATIGAVFGNETLRFVVKAWSKPALAIFYGSGILLLCQIPVWRRVLQPLANVGRMALSNYLAISLIGVSLFYGIGLGLYGRVSWLAGICLVMCFFLGQVAVSSLWMSRFNFGPAEWLWRSLTYRHKQFLRRSA